MSATLESTPTTRRVWNELESSLAEGHSALPLRILFATDGSEHAEQARELLKALPLAAGSAVHFTTIVTKDSWERPDWLQEALHEWARRIDQASTQGLNWTGVDLTTEIREGREAEQILEAAETFRADLIMVGSRGLTGLEGFLVGSVARNVAKHAEVPVLIAHAPVHGLAEVVLAVDSSEHAADAVRLVSHFPLPEETRITVVHVVKPVHPAVGLAAIDTAQVYEALQQVESAQKEQGEALATAVAERLREAGREVAVEVRVGDPASEILEAAAERHADLIVAGARGHSGIEGLLTGSVADRLIKTARCSVLISR